MHWIVLGSAFGIFWILSLQVVLPIGNRTIEETRQNRVAGTDPGAPANPRLGRKLVLATGVASAMWLVLYSLVLLKVLDL